MNAAAPGDRIVLTAGETFVGNFILPYKGPSGDPIVIESSAMDKLPAGGYRVLPEHAEFMPKLVPSDRGMPVLRSGADEQYVSRVDPANDTVYFQYQHYYRNGERIAFWVDGPPPGGVQGEKPYFVRVVSPTAFQLLADKDGPVVDITTPFTGNAIRATSMEPGSRYSIRGIEMTVAPNTTHEYDLVQIGTNVAVLREALTTQIELDRVYIHGVPTQNGPRICLLINARQFSLVNSRLEHCNKEGEESKAITFIMAPGPGTIRNNYIEGGAINLLMGGDWVRIKNLVSGDEGGIEIFGNHFFKPLRLKYTAGPGGPANPAGRCSGGYYLNSTTGEWFACENETRWVPGPVCARGEYYRRNDVPQTCDGGACWECVESNRFERSKMYRGSGYFVKNLLEIKSGKNLYIHGNVFENNWVNGDQSGVGIWVISQVAQGNANGWVRGEDILFTNNIVRNSAQGVRVASEGSTVFGMPNRNVRVVNNLFYDIGATSTPSIASNDARPISFAGECVDCQFTNNTILSGVRAGTGIYFDTKPLTNFRFANNIFNGNLYGVLGDGGVPLSYYLPRASLTNNIMVVNTPESARFAPGNNRIIANTVPLFLNSTQKNFRIDPDSPFSAGCLQKCEYAADDGRNPGADVDRVEEDSAGAIAGGPNWDEQFGLSTSVTEPSKASISYYVRGDDRCSLRVSNSVVLRTVIPDVDPDAGDGREFDDREGNSNDGGAQRTFVVGTRAPLEANTQYYFKLQCGVRHMTGNFKTPADK
jgi:hypothetical protein